MKKKSKGKHSSGHLLTPDDYTGNVVEQPGFEGQLTLIKSEMSVKKKLVIAGTVVLSLFAAGMAFGVLAGFFIF